MRSGFVFMLLLVVSSTGLAQGEPEEPREEFAEEMEVTEVVLDVLVTDKTGKIVVGLDEDDFVVEEDGERVELTGVTFYSNREFLASTDLARELDVDPDVVPAARHFILFFHDQRMLAPQLGRQMIDAVRGTRRWIRKELLPTDYVAVVGYGARLRLHRDFTNDPEKILEGVDAVLGAEEPEKWPSRREETGAGTASLFARLPPPDDEALADLTASIYGGLALVARAAGFVEGRKNLVLFSLGFGDLDQFGSYRRDDRYYPTLVRVLNANNVAVYGLYINSTAPGRPFGFRGVGEALNDLARDTGGEAYYDFTTFRNPLEKLGDENNGYYLLSFSSRHPKGATGYQEVEVETTNPEFRVKGRGGYRYGGR